MRTRSATPEFAARWEDRAISSNFTAGTARGVNNMPHGMSVVPGKDTRLQSKFWNSSAAQKSTRMKLFPGEPFKIRVRLGTSLLPKAKRTTRKLEFRFFVVEDPSINAQALPTHGNR